MIVERSINQRRSHTFYKPIDVHSVTNVVGKSISSMNMENIGNQLGKQHFSCG